MLARMQDPQGICKEAPNARCSHLPSSAFVLPLISGRAELWNVYAQPPLHLETHLE